MRALGLWQPWAGLIRLGIKTIETRFWGTNVRGDAVICSTKRVDPSFPSIVLQLQAAGQEIDVEELLSAGCMECIVSIDCCRLAEDGDQERACCPVFDLNPRTNRVERKHVFELSNVRPVKRKPVKNGQRWFNISDELVEEEK